MNVALAPEYSARVRRAEPLSRHTSWHVGGPAEVFFNPRDVADLAAFLRALPAGTPIHWIGLGSNLLVRDGGLPGVVISTHGTLDTLARLNQTTVRAEAGIPGTLGGALAMNAGAFGGETWRHVASVEIIDRGGHTRRRAASEYQIAYREVVAPAPEEWFIAAELAFEQRPGAHADEVRSLLAQRKASQPIGEWSCGSVFTNPPGDHAARLIETAGLKGFRIGDASVSRKHANFIINHGQASAHDLESLIGHVRETVARVHGVALHPEVRIVGEP